ncbi:tyrosine-type recombinase/integrase [Azospirillum griseum]
MGFRKAEVFGLTIDQVDIKNRGVWLEANATKGKRAEFIPANPEALELLTRLVGQARRWKVRHLLTYQHGEKGERRPVKNPKRAWRTALDKLGLEHRFHDTKASFVTAVAHVATAAVTQQLARHKNYETTRRYLKVADEAARQAMEQATMTSLRVGNGSTSTQEFHTQGTTHDDQAIDAGNKKALEPLGSKAFPLCSELVGATGFEPATPRPPV